MLSPDFPFKDEGKLIAANNFFFCINQVYLVCIFKYLIWVMWFNFTFKLLHRLSRLPCEQEDLFFYVQDPGCAIKSKQ